MIKITKANNGFAIETENGWHVIEGKQSNLRILEEVAKELKIMASISVEDKYEDFKHGVEDANI